MYNLWRHITQSVLVVLLLVSGIWETYATNSTEVRVGDITTLAVKQQGSNIYHWELYDHATGVNFATTSGNCPETKARFVNGKNTGASVQVEWLEEGEYFYKAITQDGCANNMKIGRIIIKKPAVPRPSIQVTYDCQRGVAILKAVNYTGELLWSTGETAEQIEVTDSGDYTLVQKIEGRTSKPSKIFVESIIPKAPMNVMVTTAVVRGEQTQLLADGCDNGTLHWYRDKELTDEIFDSVVAPEETTAYYVVCKNNIGCTSEATEVIVYIEDSDMQCDKMFEKLAQNQLVTPNEDGSNDLWDLRNLQRYCQRCNKIARVQLFNRWGSEVYNQSNKDSKIESFEGYSKNTWDFNREVKLPDGVYFYIITINGKEKGVSGYIQIIGSREYPYTPGAQREW